MPNYNSILKRLKEMPVPSPEQRKMLMAAMMMSPIAGGVAGGVVGKAIKKGVDTGKPILKKKYNEMTRPAIKAKSR